MIIMTQICLNVRQAGTDQANPNTDVPTFMGKYHLVHCNLGLCASSPSVLIKGHFFVKTEFCLENTVLKRKRNLLLHDENDFLRLSCPRSADL